MPRRPHDSVNLESVPGALEPLLQGRGADLSTALQATVTWANSSSYRETLMRESGFPLADDSAAFLLLNQLIYRVTARPTDMADAIRTGRSNVSKIVRRLEQAGLVGRMPDPTDGRQSVIGLTQSGREMGQRILEVNERLYGSAFSEWTADELDLFEALFVKFVDALDDAGAGIERAAGVRLPDRRSTASTTSPRSLSEPLR